MGMGPLHHTHLHADTRAVHGAEDGGSVPS